MILSTLDYPPATTHVGDLVGDETRVCLFRDCTGFERLRELRSLRELRCSGITPARLDVLAACDQLRVLDLAAVRVSDLEPLSALGHLQWLRIDGATKVESLGWLERLPALSQLSLEGFSRVTSLEALGTQTDLEALDVSGSMWTRMTVRSFSPLAGMDRLRGLSLLNIKALDDSLDVLAELPALERLDIARFSHWSAFARLAGRRPDVRCSWFDPYVRFAGQVCSSCGQKLVMLTGRRQPTLCPSCDAPRVGRHAARFQQVAREAAGS
jgi:Leucine-rich repeat (LRR) protein